MRAVLQYYDTTIGAYKDVGTVRTRDGKAFTVEAVTQTDRLGDTQTVGYKVTVEARALTLDTNFLDDPSYAFRVKFPDDLKHVLLGTREYQMEFDALPARNEIVYHNILLSFIVTDYETFADIVEIPLTQPEGDFSAWTAVNGGNYTTPSTVDDSRGFELFDLVDGSTGTAQYMTYVFASTDFPEDFERHCSFTMEKQPTGPGHNHCAAFCLSQVSGAEFDFVCVVKVTTGELYFKDTYNWLTYSEVTIDENDEILVRFGLRYGGEGGTNLTGGTFSAYSGISPVDVEQEGASVQGDTTMSALAISD